MPEPRALLGNVVLSGSVPERGSAQRGGTAKSPNTLLNDVQSQLNATRVCQIIRPRSIEEIETLLAAARRQRMTVSVAGGRHAMGGQQFAKDSLHVDTTQFNRVLQLDEKRGTATVESGIQWPALIEELHRRQPGSDQPWTIREK